MYKAHRYAYEFFNGEIPENKLVLHNCDNPACVNPDHLRLGTYQDNIDDMVKRKRKSFGRNPDHLHLSFQIAETIRDFADKNPTLSQKEISKHFQVSTAQVCRILSNKIWKNPEEL